MHETPLTALVLGGGGARAAYQVGVLRSILRIRREVLGPKAHHVNPFGVICGTSAGAINAAALAVHADRFEAAVEVLARVWREFSADQVYRADSLGVIRTGAQWLTMLSVGWVIARWRRARPRSLLDNEPLHELLARLVPLDRLPAQLAAGHLHALAVTASSYSSGEHHTFFSAREAIPPWVRSQRVAVPGAITADHLLASSAIPFVFPAQRLSVQGQLGWYGDGSMRQTAPLSSAIHLGAQRLLVVAAGRMNEPPAHVPRDPEYPHLAQVAGHALSSIFLDTLALDIERLKRLNRLLALLPDETASDVEFRKLEILVIAPSQRLDDIAARHIASLPAPVRALLRGAGVTSPDVGQARGSALASYLLFEAPFTQELVALGEADTLARRDEVLQFFGWTAAGRARREGAAAAAPGRGSDATQAAPDLELP